MNENVARQHRGEAITWMNVDSGPIKRYVISPVDDNVIVVVFVPVCVPVTSEASALRVFFLVPAGHIVHDPGDQR